MKRVIRYHKWTDDELKRLMCMWLNGDDVAVIADAFSITTHGVNKQIQRMRADGIPLPRRRAGNRPERANKPWTQSEVEYLVRRRAEGATADEIGNDLGRTFLAVQGMVRVLIKEGVTMPMFGNGVRRLWNADTLRTALVARNVIQLEKKA